MTRCSTASAYRMHPGNGHPRHWALLTCSIVVPTVLVNLSLLSHWNLSYKPEQMLVAETSGTFKFPELELFQVHIGGGAMECVGQPITVKAHSLQQALRVCLARSGCSALQWEKTTHTTRLCRAQHLQTTLSSHSMAAITAYSATRKTASQPRVGNGSSFAAKPCPDGQEPVPGASEGECTVCKGGWCSILPSARLIPGFNARVEKEMERLHIDRSLNYRGFNPAAFSHNGQTYMLLRSANFTKCTDTVSVDHRRFPYDTQVYLCLLDGTLRPFNCKPLPLEVTKLRNPFSKLAFSDKYIGLEDARAFVWRGRVFLLGTVLMGAYHQRKLVNQMGLLKLDETRSHMEYGKVLNCGGSTKRVPVKAKNFMPLVIGDNLYLVLQPYPLVVGKVDHSTLKCRVVQRDTIEDTPSLQAVLGNSSFLSGSTPFVPLGPGRFVALSHHHYKQRGVGRVYMHHFVIISAKSADGGSRFAVEWVSEAFRLPTEQEEESSVQFATGILAKDGGLHISYGVSDCYAALALVSNFREKIEMWQTHGIGSQNAHQRY